MRFIKSEYEKKFSCIVGAFATGGGPLSVFTSDGKAYDIDDDNLTWEQVLTNNEDLMKESIRTGKNLLVEKYKDREYEVEPLNLDYDY